MNKFSLQTPLPETDETKPVLYNIYLGNKYYLHKGKTLQESAERFLEDIFRGMRQKSCPVQYSEVIKYCELHPQIYKASLLVVLNDEPGKILRKETALYKSIKTDPQCLNRTDLEPYKPEWMIKQSLQKRCENCLYEGLVLGKKIKFKFCPNCGRLNK